MKTKHKRRVKKGSGSRKGSTCDLCAHEDDTPCSASCVKGLENPLVTNSVCFQRRSPLVTAFYCQCAQLYGEIHKMTLLPMSDNFQEDVVTEMGAKVLTKFAQVLEDSTSDSDNTPPMCPFVMMLSILMPSLRKHVDWVVHTRPIWAYGDGGSNNSSSTQSSNVLLTMIALHNVLMEVTLECDTLAHLIELNEGMGEEQVHARPPKPATSFTSNGGGGGANASVAVPPAINLSLPSQRIPQIKKITLEFEDIDAEYKCQLAELTESILEATEVIEFMELLVLQLLDPIGKRVLASPSPSWPYLCPRIIERCISVAMNEFVFDNVKMNEILAAQFEKGVAYLRSWSLKLEMSYNSHIRKVSHMSLSPRSSQSQLSAIAAVSGSPVSSSTPTTNFPHNGGPNGAPQKLQLVALDGFKRLDHVLNTWLRGANKEEEVLSARTRMKANLGGLRTTIVRSISTKVAK